MDKKVRKEIVDLVSQGQAAAAIDRLRALFEKKGAGSALLPAIYSLSARQQKLLDDKNKGILFKEDEAVLQNRINDDLIALIGQMGNPAPVQVPPPSSPAAPAAPSPARWPWLLGFGGLLVAAYFIFGRDRLELVNLSVCTFRQIDQDHCCREDLTRMRLEEARYSLYFSFVFNQTLEDPAIRGVLTDALGREIATLQGIGFDQVENELCYSTVIALAPGFDWKTGSYTLTVFVNDEKTATKEFTLID